MAVRTWNLAAALAVLAGFSACSEDGTGPASSLAPENVATAALVTDAVTSTILLQQMTAAGAGEAFATLGTETRHFSQNRECPAGGSIAVEGTAERMRDGAVVTAVFSAAGTWDDCAFARRRQTITLNGTFLVQAELRRENGQPAGPQTTTQSGQFTWSATNGASGSCEYAITSVRSPSEGKRSVTGTVCGRTIDRSVEWDRQN